jgi:hypothetical protein
MGKNMQNKSFVKILIGTFLLISTSVVNAETIEDGRLWLNFSLQGALPVESWNWSVDLRPRWRDEGRHFDQFLSSLFINKTMTPKFALGFGVDHVVSHPANRESFEENRAVLQMQYFLDDFAGVRLSSRTRFEFRYREDFDDAAYRFREQIRASYPLKAMPSVSAVIFDELLINLNNTDWNVTRGVDQNRLFAGFAYQGNKHTSFEFGYLHQLVNTKTIDQENHILSVILRHQF